MPDTLFVPHYAGLKLEGKTAADLMGPNPISLRQDATVPEAVALFLAQGAQAAPVIDEAGHPVGVLSQTDILIHQRAWGGEDPPAASPEEDRVADLMTPAVFAVPLDYPAASLVDDLIRLKVHQLFVVDPGGILVGAVGCRDVLQHTWPEARER